MGVKLGYTECNKGRTSGSRVMFVKEYRNNEGEVIYIYKIMLHKPHPGDIIKDYAVRDFLAALERNGDIL